MPQPEDGQAVKPRFWSIAFRRRAGHTPVTVYPDSNPYPYRALDQSRSEVRLLRVASERSTGTEQIRASLLQVSLDEYPRYEAISYAWGDPAPVRQILVDDHTIRIPENTWQAIRRMRLPDAERTVWIDALCINQLDTDERARQVRLMGRVYSSCAATLVYLGDGGPLVHQAVAEVRRCGSLCPPVSREDPTDPPQIVPDEKALLELFDIPWFRRVWVTQEVALAPTTLFFVADLTFELEPLSRTAYWMGRPSIFPSADLTNSAGRRGVDAITVVTYAFRNGVEPSLAQELRGRRDLEASDHRDRVYGVLGMTHRDMGIPRLLAPDYDKPYHAVIRDAVRYTVVLERDLHCLALVRHRSMKDLKASDFPSWVPRLDRPTHQHHDPLALRSLVERAGLMSKSNMEFVKQYAAYAVEENDAHILQLDGIAVNTISRVSKTLSVPRSKSQTATQTCRSCVKMAQSFAAKWNFNDSERLDRTAAGNSDYNRNPLPLAEYSLMDALDRHLQNGGDIPLTSSEAQSLPESSDKKLLVFAHSLSEFAELRRLAVTQSGYLCLVPKLSRRGDIVMATTYPQCMTFVLRPLKDSTYYMLGECYVDELRTVELVQQFAAGKVQQTFDIR